LSRGRRVRLEAGIYRDALGLAAVVKVQGQQQEKRFAADTDLQRLRIWRADTTSALLQRSQLTSDRGTFARDVARFLRTTKGRAGARADRSHLKPWVLAFGRGSRHQITRARVLELLAQLDDGRPGAAHAPASRARPARSPRARRSGRPHPLTKLKLPRPAKTRRSRSARRHRGGRAEPRVRPHAAQRCGRSDADADPARGPAEDLRALPRVRDVRPAAGADRRARSPATCSSPAISRCGLCGRPRAAIRSCCRSTTTWRTPGRSSGGRGLGRIRRRSFAKTLRRHGWPTGVRPYRMRHTFAIDLLLKGVPLETLQGLSGI
jgi:hypothetical protein